MKKGDINRTNIAIIGLGRIAVLLEKDNKRYKPCTHIGALQEVISKNPEAFRIYLHDIDKEHTNEAFRFLEKKNKNLKISVFDEIHSIPKPDVLIIATPSETHFDYLSTAIQLNIQRIVIEKPIAVSQKEVKKLHRSLKKYSGKIWVNYERRYHPKYIQLKENIQNQMYGKLIDYEGGYLSKWNNLYPEKIKKNTGFQYSEGILLRDTTHLVDLVQFFFGKIIHYDERRGMNFHTFFMEHSFHNATGSIKTIANAPYFHFELILRFEKKTIHVGNGFLIEQKIDNANLLIPIQKPVYKSDYRLTKKNNPFIRLYESIIYERENLTSVEDALDNVSILSKK